MGFGPGSSDSSASDSRIGAADKARVNRGSHNISNEGKNSKSVSTKGKLQESGAVDLSNAKVNTGVSNSKISTTTTGLALNNLKGNVTIGDASEVTSLTEKFLDTVQTLSANNNATLSNAIASASQPPQVSLTAPAPTPQDTGLASLSSVIDDAKGLGNQDQAKTNTKKKWLLWGGIALGAALLIWAATKFFKRHG
jgi:hypothetical protein